MAEKQLAVSDVKIKSVTLESASFGKVPYDLVPHLRELNIYESLFSNSLKANVTLDESVNLPEKFPIVGEERVKFDIEIPGLMTKYDDGTSLSNDLPMYVHKISNRKLKAPQSQEFALELVSTGYMNNIHSRISKSYSAMKAGGGGGIAMDIWMNYLWGADRGENGIFEPTEREEQCVIPNWTPFQTLNWLASRSTSKNNKGAANFVFYESMHGSNFRSIDSMIIKGPVLLFAMEPAFVDPHKVQYLAQTTEPLPVVKCDSIDLVQQPEMVKNINRGAYASKLITHDIVTKKITQYEYNLDAEWNTTNHLNKTPPITFAGRELRVNKQVSFGPSHDNHTKSGYRSGLNNYSDSAVLFSPKHNQMFSENPNHEYDNEVEKWRLQRNSQLTLLDGTKFYIQCGGIPSLRVGMCANIHMMSPEGYRKHEDSEDTILSGKCLITAIKHIITNQFGNSEYKMELELVKDGIGK
jgi:hypothetical protein